MTAERVDEAAESALVVYQGLYSRSV